MSDALKKENLLIHFKQNNLVNVELKKKTI